MPSRIKRFRRTRDRMPMRRRSYRVSFTRQLTKTGNKIHNFKRTLYTSIQINPFNGIVHYGNIGAGIGAAGSFNLGELPNSAEFTALFDQYRICAVKMKFVYSNNVSQGSSVGNTATNLPNLYTVLDKDDGTPFTTIAQMTESDTFKVSRLDRVVTRFIRPRPATAVYQGAFTGYAQQISNPWIDAGTPAVQYYGIKWAVDPIVTTLNENIGILDVFCTFYLQCRDVR